MSTILIDGFSKCAKDCLADIIQNAMGSNEEKDFDAEWYCDANGENPILVQLVKNQETGLLETFDLAGNAVDVSTMTKCPDVSSVLQQWCDSADPNKSYLQIICKKGATVDLTNSVWIDPDTNTVLSEKPATAVLCKESARVLGEDCRNGFIHNVLYEVDDTGNLIELSSVATAKECEKECLTGDCWKDQFVEGGLDNTFTQFNHTNQVFNVTFDNGDTDTFTIASATGWSNQVIQMATGLSGVMPWAQTVDPFCTNGCGGLQAPFVPLNLMALRYVGFRVCPGDKVPVKVEYTSDQQTTPKQLIIQYTTTDTIYFKKNFDCDGNLVSTKLEDGTDYTPVCAIPCGEDFPETPLAQCSVEYSDGCDNVNSTDQSDFVSIVRAITNCGDGPEVAYLQEDADGALVEYTLVGSFVDCSSGQAVPEPEPTCEKDLCDIHDQIESVTTECASSSNLWLLLSKCPLTPDQCGVSFPGIVQVGQNLDGTHPQGDYAGGSINGWNAFALCSETQPVNDGNEHYWIQGSIDDFGTYTYERVDADPVCASTEEKKAFQTTGCNDDRRDDLLAQLIAAVQANQAPDYTAILTAIRDNTAATAGNTAPIESKLDDIIAALANLDSNDDTAELNAIVAQLADVIVELQKLDANTDGLEAAVAAVSAAITTEGDQTQAFLSQLLADAQLTNTTDCNGDAAKRIYAPCTDQLLRDLITAVQANQAPDYTALLTAIRDNTAATVGNTAPVVGKLDDIIAALGNLDSADDTTELNAIAASLLDVVSELQTIDANTDGLEAGINAVVTTITTEGDQTQVLLQSILDKMCTDTATPLTHVSGTGAIPVGLKSVTIKSTAPGTVINGDYPLSVNETISYGTDRGNCINEVLPAIPVTGGSWAWTGLRD